MSTHETLVPFEVISSGSIALVLPFQQHLEGPIEVLLCECVNDLRHSLFHLLNCLITTHFELREQPKVTGSKLRTKGRVWNCLDAHLGQIVCDNDGVVDWCIVLVEMSLTRFEECWPLLTESLPELPKDLNIRTLIQTVSPINSGGFTSLLPPRLRHPSQIPCLSWISYATQRLMLDSCMRACFHWEFCLLVSGSKQ